MNTNQPEDNLVPRDATQKIQAEQQSKKADNTDPATLGQQGNINPQNVDQKLQEDQKEKTAADFDQMAREAEADTQTRKPGASNGNNSDQHNNGRGGGK